MSARRLGVVGVVGVVLLWLLGALLGVAMGSVELVLGSMSGKAPKGKQGDGGKGDEELLTLRGPDARKHYRVLGVTGAGKSKFLATLILQLINIGISVILLDPAGDLCDDVLMALWDTRFFADGGERAFTRVRYLDYGRRDAYVPSDVLFQPGRETYEIASLVLEAVHRANPDIATGAPMIDNFILYSSFLLIVNRQPLTSLPLLLTDESYRASLLRCVTDPQVLEYFRRFEEAGRRGNTQIESTLRRVTLLTFAPELRFSLGAAGRNALHMRSPMDAGTSVLINLGGLPAQSQRLIGSLVAVFTEDAALSRADLPEERRRPATFVVDEWSMFSVQSEEAMERILALTRKYGLQLVLASQTLSQTSGKLEGALQNSQAIVFRVGRRDADEISSALFTPDPYRLKQHPDMRTTYMSLSEQRLELEGELTSLPPRVAYTRLGEATIKFRSLGLQTPQCTRAQLEALKDAYARRLLVPRAVIEREMAGMAGMTNRPEAPESPERPDVPQAPVPGVPGTAAMAGAPERGRASHVSPTSSSPPASPPATRRPFLRRKTTLPHADRADRADGADAGN